MATEQDTVECPICKRCFIHKTTLTEHQELSCEPRSVFICPPCNKHFENGWYLDQHLVRHQHIDGEKPERNFEDVQCSNCSGSFRSSITLATHRTYCCSTTPQRETEEQCIETSDDEKLHIVEKCSREKKKTTGKAKTNGKKVKASLKIILKKNKTQSNTPAKNGSFVEQAFENIPGTVADKSTLVENTLKLLLTTLKKDHVSMKQGELAFLYQTEEIVRVVKVLQISDGVFRGVPYEITNNKMVFQKKTEILQLEDVLCHGRFEFPKIKQRKQECDAYQCVLISFKLMPALVNAILTQPTEVEGLVGTDVASSWYGGYEGTVNRDEQGKKPSTITKNTSNDKNSDTSNNGYDTTMNNHGTTENEITMSGSSNGDNDTTNNHVTTKNETATITTGNSITPTSSCNTNKQQLVKLTDKKIANTDTIGRDIIANGEKNAKEKTEASKKEIAAQCETEGSDVKSVEVWKEEKVEEEKIIIEEKLDEKRPLVMKAYPCRICRRCFVYEETRNLHEDNVCRNKRKTKDDQKYSCSLCNWQLSTPLEYDLHTVMKCSPKKTISPQQDLKPMNTCKYCQQQFVHVTTLATHLDYCCTTK